MKAGSTFGILLILTLLLSQLTSAQSKYFFKTTQALELQQKEARAAADSEVVDAIGQELSKRKRELKTATILEQQLDKRLAIEDYFGADSIKNRIDALKEKKEKVKELRSGIVASLKAEDYGKAEEYKTQLMAVHEQWSKQAPMPSASVAHESERTVQETGIEKTSGKQEEEERLKREAAEKLKRQQAEEKRIAEEMAAKKAEEERIEAERLKQQQAEEKRIAEELAAKKAEEERIQAEKLRLQQQEQKRLEAELAAIEAEEKRIAAEKAERERQIAEKEAKERERQKRIERARQIAMENEYQRQLAFENMTDYTETVAEKIYFEDFDDNQVDFTVSTVADRYKGPHNGAYESRQYGHDRDGFSYTTLNISTDTQKDFSISSKVLYIQGSRENFMGLVWGGSGRSFFCFGFNKDGTYLISEYENGQLRKEHASQKKCPAIKDNWTNVLSIAKIGEEWVFAINKKVVHRMPFGGMYGINSGFMLPYNATVRYDDFTVNYLADQ